MDGSLVALVVMLPAVSIGGIFCIVEVSKRLYGNLRVFQILPQENARGYICTNEEIYLSSELESEEHIRLQQETLKHADGGPVYCNTFRGWKKRYYDYMYQKTINSDRRAVKQKSKRELKEARSLAVEAKRVSALSLESQLHQNRKAKAGK